MALSLESLMKLGKEVANLYFCNLKMALSLESLMKLSKEVAN